ncbi:MAG TPA: UvrB/UvrC motif-containing protein, partial [Verrucomicrobiae bacterium]|nr:UvrB/UvrC motif-containing protein [Verrucomicrobiae bacterium]
LGCAECYKTFAEGLESLLKTMHKGTRHTGKVPAALRQSREQADRLKTLQVKLLKAIQDENFEQAAKLRDEIKQVTPRTGGVSVA